MSVRVLWDRKGPYKGEVMNLARVEAEQMYEAGLWVATQVENRTQSGRDEAGARFRPYSPTYAKQKNVAPTNVTLTRTGDMFSTWGVLWAAVNKARLGFSSKAMEQRARYNEGMGRRFLGIEERWLRELKRRIAKGIGFTRS